MNKDEGSLLSYLSQAPLLWVEALPAYQQEPITEMLSNGMSFEQVSCILDGATSEYTERFGASPEGAVNKFLPNVSKEVRAFLCGDKKYKTEREGLFGEKGVARTYLIGALAVVISPAVGAAAPVISPLIALTLAVVCKISIGAYCAMEVDQPN